MIKLIIFDLDGVLVDAKEIHYESLNKALKQIDEKFVITREELLNKLVQSISRDKNSILDLKMRLQNYYKSNADYEVSLRGGPVTDKDTGFLEALKNFENSQAL